MPCSVLYVILLRPMYEALYVLQEHSRSDVTQLLDLLSASFETCTRPPTSSSDSLPGSDQASTAMTNTTNTLKDRKTRIESELWTTRVRSGYTSIDRRSAKWSINSFFDRSTVFERMCTSVAERRLKTNYESTDVLVMSNDGFGEQKAEDFMVSLSWLLDSATS